MEASETLQLAVIVVCYHSDSVIQSCVDALDDAISAMPHDSRPQVELVLVANSPMDHIAEVTSRRCRIIPFTAPGNVGFSPAVNLGFAAVSHADYILLLNPDAQLADRCIANLLSEAKTRRAVIAGPILCDPVGQPHGFSERPFHSLRRELATQLLGAERRRPPYGEYAYETGNARCLTGACLLVEGSFFRAVGGLDTDVHMYLEDVMLCWQAHQCGERVLLVRDAYCCHALGASTDGANFESSIGLHLTLLGARVTFIRRTSGASHAAVLRLIIGAGAALRAMCLRGEQRKRHVAVLRWAITSGAPPPWRNGPISTAN